MNQGLFILPLLAVLVMSPLVVFAENTHTIIMPSGSSDRNAPFYWSEKNTGNTTGEITIYPNDSVIWENADSVPHTITSVTQSGKIDGKFDSGLIDGGNSYTRQFSELGDFYYFCIPHPWMNGIVHVVKNPGSVKSITNVASGLSDDGLGFTVKYVLDTSIQKTVKINPDEKTLIFNISGNTQNEQIILILPVELIEIPNAVWVDGIKTDFEAEITSTGTKLIIPIQPNSKEIKIMGIHVIPEFGFLAMSVLTVGLIATIFFTRSKISLN